VVDKEIWIFFIHIYQLGEKKLYLKSCVFVVKNPAV